jgi:hypothetical protein
LSGQFDRIGLYSDKLATENGLNVAYSCEAFDIWWLFHFMEITKPIQRKDYEKKLQKHFPEYKFRDKGHSQSERMRIQLDKIIFTNITAL